MKDDVNRIADKVVALGDDGKGCKALDEMQSLSATEWRQVWNAAAAKEAAKPEPKAYPYASFKTTDKTSESGNFAFWHPDKGSTYMLFGRLERNSGEQFEGNSGYNREQQVNTNCVEHDYKPGEK